MKGEIERRPEAGAVDLAGVPSLIRRERAELAELVDPVDVAQSERRAAAIAELTRRAGLAVPVQNEAMLYRAEALERLAVVVKEAQNTGEVAREAVDGGRPKLVRASDQFRIGAEATAQRQTLKQLGIDKRRLAEGRALAETDVLARARADVERRPEKPLRFADLIDRAQRVRRTQDLAEKRERLERGARIERLRLEVLGEQPVVLDVGDVRTWRPARSVDAVITDPPYITEDALDLYSALADLALDVLEPGGVLATLVWPPMLVDVVERMRRDGLTFRWPIVWRFVGNKISPDRSRRVFDQTKFVLVYHRGAMPADAPYLRDTVESPGEEKDLHVWQQSLAVTEQLLGLLTWPGATVCDPFLGSGTTAVAALRTERRFVGCDIDQAAVEIARQRLES